MEAPQPCPWRNLHVTPFLSQVAKQLSEVADFIRARLGTPDLALVLGSGLSGIQEQLEERSVNAKLCQELLYSDIPNMPQATVVGHGKKLIMGSIGSKRILCWSGRVHGYEGYSPLEVSFIAYVTAFLGARGIILTNAAGGLCTHFKQGQIMLIRDYMQWAVGCPENSNLRYDSALLEDCVMGPRNLFGEAPFSEYL